MKKSPDSPSGLSCLSGFGALGALAIGLRAAAARIVLPAADRWLSWKPAALSFRRANRVSLVPGHRPTAGSVALRAKREFLACKSGDSTPSAYRGSVRL